MGKPRSSFVRWTRACVVLCGAFFLLWIVLPIVGEIIAKEVLAARLEQRFGGKAGIERLRLALGGSGTLVGLVAEDGEGRSVLEVSEMTATISLFDLLKGEVRMSAELRGFELTLRQRGDGTWNYEDWSSPDEEPEGNAGEHPSHEKDAGLPFHGVFLLSEGRVELQGNEGTLRIEEIELEARLPEEEATAEILLRARIAPSEDFYQDSASDTPELAAELSLLLDLDSYDIGRCRLDLDSDVLRGNVQGQARGIREWLESGAESPATLDRLTADLEYRPAELARLLGPLLPVTIKERLSGEKQERIEVELSGAVSAGEPFAILSGLDGTIRAGLGRVETRWIAAEGDMVLARAADGWNCDLNLTANGGSLHLLGVMGDGPDSAEKGGLQLGLRAGDVGLTSELAPLLTRVHPAFIALENLGEARAAGVFSCDLDLAYGGDLVGLMTALADDEFECRIQSEISGRGSLRIDAARLRDAPLVAEMLETLGIDSQRELHIRPIEFTIQHGRLEYDRDWTWTLGGVETTFTGSVGLDQTLDLSWNVPVTPELIERRGFLRALRGDTLHLPITGTVDRPELDWRGTLDGLVRKFAQEKVLGELGLGDAREDSGETAVGLLQTADRLWDAGEKSRAAAIYRRIKDEFKISLAYTLNRSRIKRRGKNP